VRCRLCTLRFLSTQQDCNFSQGDSVCCLPPSHPPPHTVSSPAPEQYPQPRPTGSESELGAQAPLVIDTKKRRTHEPESCHGVARRGAARLRQVTAGGTWAPRHPLHQNASPFLCALPLRRRSPRAENPHQITRKCAVTPAPTPPRRPATAATAATADTHRRRATTPRRSRPRAITPCWLRLRLQPQPLPAPPHPTISSTPSSPSSCSAPPLPLQRLRPPPPLNRRSNGSRLPPHIKR
jgi:hypothetical protein